MPAYKGRNVVLGIAATMLVEFAHFEWRKGDNEGGGLMLI